MNRTSWAILFGTSAVGYIGYLWFTSWSLADFEYHLGHAIVDLVMGVVLVAIVTALGMGFSRLIYGRRR